MAEAAQPAQGREQGVILGQRPAPRTRAFTFTYNNPPDDVYATLVTTFTVARASKWCFQLEQGAQHTQHIQGVVYFPNGRSLSSVRQLLPGCHIECCKNWIASVIYCSKLEGRLQPPEMKNCAIPNRKRKRDDAEPAVDPSVKFEEELQFPLKDWQQEVLDLYDIEPDDRTIWWYTGILGGEGKTKLARYMCLRYSDVLYLSGKAADMKHCVANFVRLTKKSPKMIIVNLPRTLSDVGIPTIITGLEQIKDACFFSGKYESTQCIYKYCHVVVFANIMPPDGSLSADRIRYKEVQ